MSSVYIGKNLRKFEGAPQFSGYTKVVLQVSEETEYAAGTDTGRTLTLVNPWGTQKMADEILAQVKGFAYQPYSASGAIVDAAAELGDAISVNSVYSGVYGLTRRYGGIQFADLNAPSDEEIDHEYPYKSPQDRRVTRQFRDVRSSLSIQAAKIAAEVEERKSQIDSVKGELSIQSGQIEAKVSKTGGSPSTFGWALNESSWTIKANGSDVLKATKSGLEVYGKISAISGKIGGLTIESNYLSYNGQTWGGTNTQGLYLGPNGIQLGKNFKVDSAGNLTAASGTFTGNVYAGNIQYGGNYGTLPGAALTSHSVYGSQIGYNTVSTSYTSNGINTSLGYADFANGVFGGWNKAQNMIVSGKFAYGNYNAGWSTISYKDHNGNNRTARVLVGQ